ncbi:hypothetical protein MXD61_03595 [Frankia sp. AgPm24]|nr:hypothetical protein [Frankia sp. AgPm24]
MATVISAAAAAGLTGAVVFCATGIAPVALSSSDADVWLPWNTAGLITHLQSTTGRADAAITIPAAASHHLTVLADGPDLLVADSDAHLLHLVEPQRLAPARSVTLPAGASVDVAPDAVGVIDSASGRVIRLDRKRLTPTGPTLDLGGPLGTTAQTADGTLWAPVRASGSVVPIMRGVPAAPIRVAPPGHAIDMVLSGDQPVVLDATAATLVPLVDGQPGRTTALAVPPADTDTDTGTGTGTGTNGGATGDSGATAANGGATANGGAGPGSARGSVTALVAAARSPRDLVLVIDTRSGRLLLADLARGGVTSIDIPASVPPASTISASTPAAATAPSGLPDIDRPAGLTSPTGPAGVAGATGQAGPVGPAAAVVAPVPGGLPGGPGGAQPAAAPTRRLTAPVWQDERIFLPDHDGGVVLVFDRGRRSFTTPIRPGPALTGADGGRPALTVSLDGDRVWINDPDSAELVLIRGDRQLVLSKQPAGLAGQADTIPPRPLPPAPPRPRPSSTLPDGAPSGPTPRATPHPRGGPGGQPDTADIPGPAGPGTQPPRPTTVATSPIQTPVPPITSPSTLPNIPHPPPTPAGEPGTGATRDAPAPARR